MELRNKVKLRMEQLNLNPNQLSKRLGKKGNGTVWSLLSGRTKSFRQMDILASALETSVDWLLERPTNFPDNTTRRFFAREPISHNIKIPIYGTAAASDGRTFGLGSDKPTDYIDTQQMLCGYATTVSGNSMAPRYLHGEYVLVVREYPAPFQDCLIQTVDGEGLIKTYIRHDQKKLVYSQLNPEKTLEIPMEKVLKFEAVRGRWK